MEKKDSKKIVLIVVLLIIVAIIFYLQNPFSSTQSTSTGELQNTENTGLEIGNLAPDFILQDTKEDEIQLSSFRGEKAVIVNFWASWCPPCREEFPLFEKAYEENKNNLEIIGVNLQEDIVKINDFASEFSISFPLLLDPAREVKEKYNVFTQPVTYFIDKNGTIVDKKFGPLTENEFNEKTAKLGIN